MKGKDLLEKMECIDPAFVEEADKTPVKKKNQTIWLKWGATAAAFAMVMMGAFMLPDVLKQNESNTPVQNNSSGVNGQQVDHTPITEPDGGNTLAGGDTASADIGGFFIPCPPQSKNVDLVGEVITDSEAKQFFTDNFSSISGSLTASGVSAEDLRISETGYCHISYDGTEGKNLEIRQNYRDYLVYNEDNLVAIITLTKENGTMSCTPSFGAKWFENYSSYLQQHAGQKLVYLYASFMEIIIAPDNTIINPMGYDVSQYFEGIDAPYERFYNENAVYIP